MNRRVDECILAFMREADGSFLVDGLRASGDGLLTLWVADIVETEGCMPDGRKFPDCVEDEGILAGGLWDAKLDAETSAKVDRDLTPARGSGSSAAAAEDLLDHFDK